MAEPELDPPAALVRRYDPALFRTALFAPEPGRSRLMTLYAFDVELSRAVSRSAEPMISRMRLQWWREVVAGAGAGEPARAHEIAEPLHGLIGERPLPPDSIEGLIEAREMELEGIAARGDFECWAGRRFGGLTRLAAECLVIDGGENSELAEAAEAGGRALAAAFALRTAAPMAATQGPMLLPDVAGERRAMLARGETDEGLRRLARDLAADGLSALARARRLRRAVPAAAGPAFLPLGTAEPVLRRAARPGVELAEIAAPGAARAAAGTLWRALSGRW